MSNTTPVTIAATASRGIRTVMGLAAILLWSSLFAITTHANAAVGALAATGWSYLIAGGLGLLAGALTGRWPDLRMFPRRYLAAGAACFVLYSVGVFLGLHLSHGAEQGMEVALANYLWPALLLALSIPILGAKARWTLGLGLLVALFGLVLVVGRGQLSASGLWAQLGADPLPCLLAAGGAAMWASYSLLTRRWLAGSQVTALPWFFLLAGVVLLSLARGLPVTQQWTARTVAETAFLGVFPGWLAYSLWDRAMQGGDVVLLGAASYGTPLLSTLCSSLYLGVPLSTALGLGCMLLIGGALICRFSITESVAAGK